MAETVDKPLGAPPCGLDVELLCPACGYDVRGSLAPRCSECGLELDRATLPSTAVARATGLFEYGYRDQAIRSLLATLWRALRPRRFWEWVTRWPAQRFPILLFGAFVFLTTLALLTLEFTLLPEAMCFWLHGNSTGCVLEASDFFVGAIQAGAMLLPFCVGAAAAWPFVRAAGLPRDRPGRYLRMAVYPAAFSLLLPLAVPARLLHTLLAYSMRADADWGTAFWWLVPGGEWTSRVYLKLFPSNWYTSAFLWTDTVRVLTGVSLVALLAPVILPRVRAARPLRVAAVVVLIVVWPVTSVYFGSVLSLCPGASTCVGCRRRRLVVATSVLCGLLAYLAVDCLFGGGALLAIVGAWPM
ncbi:MAG: hypothetical protein HY763_13710 [Planctomycetes bacterium]|nr:hypothetical protein [Planctomycetota bacterium]